jgi:hypothetical protein
MKRDEDTGTGTPGAHSACERERETPSRRAPRANG